ncbi:MAG: branched-chain amino acid aminotransferase [Bdellovibrionales bacterium]|nr:branched-chain amino acid aminotransferase [Bdellovibrionales bacterium]
MNRPISVQRTKSPKPKPSSDKLGFGKYFADHMLVQDYADGRWGEASIVPMAPFPMSPGASVLHYGQAMFEGMKAFRQANGEVAIFRPDFHFRRMESGSARLCMPFLDESAFLSALREIVRVDESWVPADKGSALYLRPTLIATEEFLGVRPSQTYRFFVITSPVGAYYSEGFGPVKIWVEEEYVRACPGGLGAVKAAANYAASLKAAEKAKKKGFSQVLWLDAKERRYVEEVGTMNIFFVLEGEVVTPPLDGTVLGGCTRDCVLALLRARGLKVSERRISIQEVQESIRSRELLEVFGTGTAAVVSPVGELAGEGWSFQVGSGGVGDLTHSLFQEITGIQYGLRPDPHGWIARV